MEFISVVVNQTFIDDAYGVMYAKPNADTVLASLYVPPGKHEDLVRAEKWITLSAMTRGFRSMENIKAWVDSYIQLPGTGKYFTLLMYRKGKEPAEDVF